MQELEASEARVRELEADALMRTMEGPLDGEASFSSTSSREPYEPPFDRDWVTAWAVLFVLLSLFTHIGLQAVLSGIAHAGTVTAVWQSCHVLSLQCSIAAKTCAPCPRCIQAKTVCLPLCFVEHVYPPPV